MIREDYCSYEVAKLLKEKGFNESCECAYSAGGQYLLSCYKGIANRKIKNDEALNFSYSYTAPTHQMAMKWLREVHNIFIELSAGETNGKTWYDFDIIPINGREIAWNHYNNLPIIECNSYEEAVEEALKYSLENLI